ncbi:hypothetical protein [Streptomyces sp. NPDC059909]
MADLPNGTQVDGSVPRMPSWGCRWSRTAVPRGWRHGGTATE